MKKGILIAVLVTPLAIVAVYLALAFSFHREHFGHRLYTLTLTGLFLTDTESNRNRVGFFRPALVTFGDGWNIYWMNEVGVIHDAERMFGPVSHLRFEGTLHELDTFLREDEIETESLLNALQAHPDRNQTEQAGAR